MFSCTSYGRRTVWVKGLIQVVASSIPGPEHTLSCSINFEPSLDALSSRFDVISSIKILSSIQSRARDTSPDGGHSTWPGQRHHASDRCFEPRPGRYSGPCVILGSTCRRSHLPATSEFPANPHPCRTPLTLSLSHSLSLSLALSRSLSLSLSYSCAGKSVCCRHGQQPRPSAQSLSRRTSFNRQSGRRARRHAGRQTGRHAGGQGDNPFAESLH